MINDFALTQGSLYISPAKVNRFLVIGPNSNSGYHQIYSAMQFLEYADWLKINPNRSGKISVFWHSHLLAPALKDNLIFKAARLLSNYLNRDDLGAEIFVDKKIPIGAGLGGGSSNAATTLFALNVLWQANLSQKKLLGLGQLLGSDVSFFLYGKSAEVFGIGDRFLPRDLKQGECVLIPPIYGPQSTSLAFAHIKKLRHDVECAHGSQLYHLTDQRKMMPDWTNDFEQGLKIRSIETWTLLKRLRSFGAAGLTGSGNALISIPRKKYARLLLSNLNDYNIPYVLTKIINRNPLFEKER